MTVFDITLPPAVEQLVSELAADGDVRSLARPSQFPASRNDYGRYMGLLAHLADSSPLADDHLANVRIWAVILERAGANRQGLIDALRVGV